MAAGDGPAGTAEALSIAARAERGAGGFSVARMAEGGKVLQRVELQENRAPFAVMLGGLDRRTLFICTAEWHMADRAPANLARLATGPRTGEILALPVDVPGTGRP
jgi:sugar lactone lactonase YvrE